MQKIGNYNLNYSQLLKDLKYIMNGDCYSFILKLIVGVSDFELVPNCFFFSAVSELMYEINDFAEKQRSNSRHHEINKIIQFPV